MKIAHILYFLILTNLTVSHIFTMEEQPTEQAKEDEFEKDQKLINWLESNPEIYNALRVFYRVPSSVDPEKTYYFPLELARKIVEDVIIHNNNLVHNNSQDLLNAIYYSNYGMKAAVRDQTNLDKIRQLLNQHYINVNIQDEYGNTPLLKATRKDRRDIVELLLENKADPNISNVNGYTALFWAISECDYKMIEKLLQKGAKPYISYMGETALHKAIKECWPSIVKLLLDYGADKYLKNENGETALDVAKKRLHGSQEIRKEIIDLLEIAD